MRNVALLVACLLVACSTPVQVRFGAHKASAPIVAFSNPGLADGDPLMGRRTFIAMQCIDCHRVAEDPTLLGGRRAIAGPQLSALKRYTPAQLAGRITSRSTGIDQELFDRTMKEYAQPMTARQLVDIVAYLRNPNLPPG